MPSILLVDDAAETRQFLAEQVLKPAGYQVTTAPDGTTAYHLAMKDPPDLLVTDYLMPEITGLELVAALREAGQTMPAILITAEGSESLAVQAMRLGVRDYLKKPFDIDDFMGAVDRILAETTPPALDLLQYAPEVVLLTDAKNRLQYYNDAAAQIFGLAPHMKQQAIGQIFSHAEVIALFENGAASDRHEIELSEHLVLNAHITSVPHLGKMVIMQDVSYFKELDRAKTDFVAAISHDLRSPLTTILGYVELLGRIGTLNEQQEKFTQNILISVRSITALINDLLELSKIETGLANTLEPTQLNTIAKYAIDTNLAELNAKEQSLKQDIAPQLSPILGHPIRLKQMIANLLQNAIKYTPPRGQVGLNIFEDDGFVILQVTDTGIGIPLEEQPLIWNKFYRVRDVVGDYPGTGLGLSIVKSIVEAHSGRIWLESTPNQGTVFTVMLPIMQVMNS